MKISQVPTHRGKQSASRVSYEPLRDHKCRKDTASSLWVGLPWGLWNKFFQGSRDYLIVSGEQYAHSHPKPLTWRLGITCVYKTWQLLARAETTGPRSISGLQNYFSTAWQVGASARQLSPPLLSLHFSFLPLLSLVLILVIHPHWKSSVNRRLWLPGQAAVRVSPSLWNVHCSCQLFILYLSERAPSNLCMDRFPPPWTLPVTREVPGIGLSLSQQRQFQLDIFLTLSPVCFSLWGTVYSWGGPGSSYGEGGAVNDSVR